MDIADHGVAEVALGALDALTDDGRTKMADVQGLCHVGAAVVDDHGAGVGILLQAEAGGRAHLLEIGRQEGWLKPEI